MVEKRTKYLKQTECTLNKKIIKFNLRNFHNIHNIVYRQKIIYWITKHVKHINIGQTRHTHRIQKMCSQQRKYIN